MSRRKFNVGDVVHINKKLPKIYISYPKDKDAIIVEHSRNECGGRKGTPDEHSYSLFIKGIGGISWYGEDTIKLVRRFKWNNSIKTKVKKEKLFLVKLYGINLAVCDEVHLEKWLKLCAKEKNLDYNNPEHRSEFEDYEDIIINKEMK